MTPDPDNPDDTFSSTAYCIGDPVVDLAQGRPMVVVATPDQTVAEWSDANDYELTENYANAKFDPDPAEPVVECVYVSDVRSEPSKTYTFPVSRVCLIDVHHADDGRRLYERVARDVLEAIFDSMLRNESIPDDELKDTAFHAGFDEDLIDEARELADVERTIGGDGAPDPSSGGGFET